MTDPWFKFYPSDWRSDPKLKMCSLPARGLWIEMIAIMHEAEPYGHLKISGVSPTPMQLAMQVGAMPDDVEKCISELENAKVFSRNRAKVIFSRRMIKDAKRRDNARINGSKGGNPSLGKTTIKSASVNPTSKGEVKAQKPEARSHIPDNKNDAKASTKKPSRASQFPEDWMPSEKAIIFCLSKGYVESQIGPMVEDCINHHKGKGNTFKDFNAAFRMWASNQIKFHGSPEQQRLKGKNNGKGFNNAQNGSGMLGAAMRSRASREDGPDIPEVRPEESDSWLLGFDE